METIRAAYETLIRWVHDSGRSWDGCRSRELYHHWDEEDPARHVTELQLPLVHSPT